LISRHTKIDETEVVAIVKVPFSGNSCRVVQRFAITSFDRNGLAVVGMLQKV